MVYRSLRGEALNWRKGSRSQSGSDCVEVAAAGPAVLIRDSRAPAAGMLTLDSAQWRTLLRAARNGELDGR
ncbi:MULTISPECIES: DUF397 domain-containing protein [Actinomadura]|jgi:hypothetical protein|uniref:DUF397 domain-containing protein n=1 Tax=Actinomadura montaniterrae TaxID=1803903 RepID=A0A6L3VD34_9ACTN|nr:DUF397 domain-containing protein [Actinomadura montaniterrae]KAB2360225.1 DUF397 domain-containing protein [Actinomadura montaniterrae]